MEGLEVGHAGAFAAGLLSFLSPCVLPLVPPYLCFIGGLTLDQLAEEQAARGLAARRVFIAALAFVLGFTTVFVALGATASVIGQVVAENFRLLGQIAGVIIIALGLHFLGLLRIPFLYREARFHVESRPAGLVGAYVVGLAFAFGWTPCVGPVLAAILFVAGAGDSVLEGTLLLTAYALGIGLPFLAAALAARPFMAFMARFRRYLGAVEKVMGGLLVLTGVLFLTGTMSEIAYWILEAFPDLGRIG
ncbi:MAG: cytochrome c biogenesis protein CcdA [Rhodospirillales bacterium]|nr:cytochrome c biogenesis protein CcdA [Rhodospirillales bacterium]MDH3910936.1 cytochrome c biogenesis protein CcdA [Rhodospirillales bacterium]MDH3917171.1 cytochrome c biogenesis protein CcdA [Rhodospirillales bacterium]MDH3968960.1 cytochrome c biogenesis protein CcdA [Rhodospirillales bacterium]